jgi:hypothetical protein
MTCLAWREARHRDPGIHKMGRLPSNELREVRKM